MFLGRADIGLVLFYALFVTVVSKGGVCVQFKKRHSNITVIAAVIHGIIIGVAAVAIVGFLFIGTSPKEEKAIEKNEVPTSGPVEEQTPAPPSEVQSSTMFALQHGVFSSAETAADFINADSIYQKAAVVQVGGQYFVWSGVGLTEDELSPEQFTEAFRKRFTLKELTCTASPAHELWTVLHEKDVAKIKTFTASIKDEESSTEVEKLKRKIVAMTTYSESLPIIRAQLIADFIQQGDCLKIDF